MTMQMGPRGIAARFAIALFLVTLLFARQMAELNQIHNRYLRQWEAADSLAIIADCILLTVLIVGLSLLVDRFAPRVARRLHPGMLVLAMTSGTLSVLVFRRISYPMIYALAWLMGVAVAGYAIGNPETRLVKLGRRTCLILSPLPLLLFSRLMLSDSWGVPPEPLRPPAIVARPDATPVFLFLFDEWSYQRSVDGVEFRPFFVHLRDFARQATVFHHALSPAGETVQSLPRLIYSSADQDAIPGALVGRRVNPVYEASRSRRPPLPPSLFEIAKGERYGTVLLGFYLPYQRMLGSQVDRYRVYTIFAKGHTFVESMFLKALENLRYWTDPISLSRFRPWYARIYEANWKEINDSLHEDVLKSISLFAPNTLVFAHYPLPHAPFIFEPDGSVRRSGKVEWGKTEHEDNDRMLGLIGSAEDNERNLRRLDNVIGNIVDRLRQTGKFEDALVIFTSDHSWRRDPKLEDSVNGVRRVPLVVKLPHQKEPRRVDGEFEAIRLKSLIEAVLEGRCNSGELARCMDPA